MDINTEPPTLQGERALHLMARVSRGQLRAQLEFLETVGLAVQRTLHRLVGAEAPIEPLLECALLRAINRAAEYVGDEPLVLWAQTSAVQVATTYLGGPNRPAPPAASGEAEPELTPKVRDLLSRVRAQLRQMRPEEQVAFALLDLDGRSLGEASSLTRTSPIVVRQRAWRARRQLLFAARHDRLIAGYVRLADPLRKLAARLQQLGAHSLGSDSLQRAQTRVVQVLTPEPQHP
jgi:DNA-directed RNA polymerase specialized sigma24 family protein